MRGMPFVGDISCRLRGESLGFFMVSLRATLANLDGLRLCFWRWSSTGVAAVTAEEGRMSLKLLSLECAGLYS